jgi:hypothetical protein
MIGMLYVRWLQMSNSTQKVYKEEYVNPPIDIKLKTDIIDLLKSNTGRMNESEVCKQLHISRNEIPWGYNIGWARVYQLDGRFDLVLSGLRSVL